MLIATNKHALPIIKILLLTHQYIHVEVCHHQVAKQHSQIRLRQQTITFPQILAPVLLTLP